MRTSKQGIGGMTHLALVAIPVILAVIVGCGGSSGGDDDAGQAEPEGTTTTTESEDVEAQATDFVNLADMTPVHGYFINNLLGHLDEAVAVAESPDGAPTRLAP